MDEYTNKGYGKRPLWQWIAIYVVIGLVVYGVIYYFVFAKKGGDVGPQPAAVNPVTTPMATTTSSATPSTAPSQTSEISTRNMLFNPSSMTVTVGTAVIWTNDDSVPHTVTSDPNGIMFDSKTLQPGDKFSFTFQQAGTFAYHCSIHTFMDGNVVVTQ